MHFMLISLSLCSLINILVHQSFHSYNNVDSLLGTSESFMLSFCYDHPSSYNVVNFKLMVIMLACI